MIPNIVKGRGVSGALAYVLSEGHIEAKEEPVAYALMRAAGTPPTKTYRQLAEGEASRAEILGGQNFGFEVHDARTVEIARRMMEWNGKPENQASRGRKCEVDCLHLMLNWEPGETPDVAEMREACASALKALGMENAQAVFVAHNDKAHFHAHVVASRIDPATGKTYSQKDDFEKAQAWGVQWDRQHGITRDSGLHTVAELIARRDHAGLLDHFTKDRPTILDATINRALKLGGLDDAARAAFKAELLAHPSLVALRDQAGGEITRYTTRQVLQAEMRAMRDAAALHGDTGHGIDAAKVDRVAAQFTLTPEQAEAVRHLTGEEGLAVLWGEAGTGKSHALKAARTAYEDDGARVVGLSWTNKVVQDMRANGFEHYDTVARQLRALESGKTAWDDNTVLMIDEAAMLSTKALGDVLGHAVAAGAKVILAGDDAQLASIEPGGIFARLREQFGAATLKDVQRVGEDAEQKAAFNAMHKGDFKTALDIFESKGAIKWTEKQDAALQGMTAAYAAAVEAEPDKTRFMFAYTNKDVAALNEQARALHKARGDLGDDVKLETAYGPQAYATGDRVQFTGNGWGQDARESGLVNGRVGTVEAVEIDKAGRARMSVTLDSGDEAQRVSFTVGEDARGGEFNSFKRGYAGTIYKGQGATLDESFVLADDKWRDSGAYVALSRHRESVHLFASREHFDDLADMARSFARSDGKDAAMSYVVEDAILFELGAEIAAEDELAKARGASDNQRNASGESAAMTDTNTTLEPMPELSRVEAVAATVEGVIDAGFEAAANVAESAVEFFADFLTGGSAPTPQSQAEQQPMTAEQEHEAGLRAFQEREYAERAANMEDIARSLGADAGKTQEAQQDEEQQRERDRGGGASL